MNKSTIKKVDCQAKSWWIKHKITIKKAACLAASWLLFTWLILSWYDPFGLGTASNAFSAKVVDRIMAPLYQSRAQDDIAVVLITADTLDRHQTAWPPQYSYHAEMLRRILDQEPRAVFVDLLFERVRSFDPSLILAKQEIQELARESGVPVYFAKSAPDSRFLFENPNIPEIRGAVVTWKGYGENYPLEVGDTGAASMTPAFVLYQEACAHTANPLPGCSAPWSRNSPTGSTAPLALRWGWFSKQSLGSWDIGLPKECLDDPKQREWPILVSVGLFGTSFAPDFYAQEIEAQRRGCAYTTTVFAHELTDLFDGSGAPLLKDKIVLLGASVPGIPDYVDTPVNGKLPGVYLHAMALDNLMKYGSGYPRAEEAVQLNLFGSLWRWSDMTMAMTVFFISLLTVWFNTWSSRVQAVDTYFVTRNYSRLFLPFLKHVMKPLALFLLLTLVALWMHARGQGSINVVGYWAIMSLPGKDGWLCKWRELVCAPITHVWRYGCGKEGPKWCCFKKEK